MIDGFLQMDDMFKLTLGSIDGLEIARGDEDYAQRIMNMKLPVELFSQIDSVANTLTISKNFKEVIDYFKAPANETPAGFKLGFELKKGGVVEADLVRDVAYGKNCIKKPTKVLYSADSVNPVEVASMKDMLSCVTCNPAIVYNLFLNNPQLNVNGKYKVRDEIIKEIADIIGPGVDMTVELNDPFGKSESEMLEEVARFREILSKWRLVVKVPHTGPVNNENVNELYDGNKLFARRYNDGVPADFFRGHNIALMLKENGYRTCLTLGHEPYQLAMALQAKPAYVTCFLMFRQNQLIHIKGLLGAYEVSNDSAFLEELRTFMIENDYLASGETAIDLHTVKSRAEYIMKYNNMDAYGYDGYEGLMGVEHSLRVLRTCNTDTKIFLCNYQGEKIYPYMDKILYSGEYDDILDRVVLTTAPAHHAQFTSSPLVVQFHRRFMNAAKGQK